MIENKMVLCQKQELIKNEMAELLIDIRIKNGFKNTFVVTRELGFSAATLRNIEEKIVFPRPRTLEALMNLYALTPKEREKLLELKNEMAKLRRKIKRLKSNNGGDL